MPVLRRRAKKMVRKKFKKTIKLSDLDKIWGEYVKYGIAKPLLRLGKFEASKLKIEIVGKKIMDDEGMMSKLINGINISRSGIVKKAVQFDKNRDDVFYNIVLTDGNYRGKLFFTADPKLASMVHDELKNTKTYYRIE
jgi:hypothetical protein